MTDARTRAEAHMRLLDARDSVDPLSEQLEIGDPLEGYTFRAFSMQVGDHNDSGSSVDVEVLTDVETGRLIVDAARKIIVQRISDLELCPHCGKPNQDDEV